MTKILTNDWTERLTLYQHLLVGFSGGLDSTVLLHALNSVPELSCKLIAVHVNHQLQPFADDWQHQCFQLCQQWHIRFIAHKVAIPHQSNIEACAREARYGVFERLIGSEDALLTAHHADDQVETFFLNLFRGAGIAGMACMPERQRFAKGMMLRPLLNHPKKTLEAYARHHQLQWIEDPSNDDSRYRRNWLRQEWLPQLEPHWPQAPTNILRSIGLLQKSYQSEQSNALNLLEKCLEAANRLAIKPLLQLSETEQKNVLRLWLKQHHIKMPTLLQLEQFFQSMIHAKKDANPSWHFGDFVARRYDGALYLLHQSQLQFPTKTVPWQRFPEPLVLPERCQQLHATLLSELPSFRQAEIRFRQGGERLYWRGKTRVLKKLLQDWSIPPWQRDSLPLLFIDGELVAVADRAVCDQWQSVMLPLAIV